MVQECDVVTTERAERLLFSVDSSRAPLTRLYKVPSETKHTSRVRRIIERRTIVSSFHEGHGATELLFAARPPVVAWNVHWMIR